MGRSQQAQVNQNAQSLFNTTTGQLPATNTATDYQNLLNNPGYTSAQQNAITGATEGGIGAAFGSAAEGAANRAGRTNNAAGLSAQEDALARQRMITSGNIGAQNQERFADSARSDRNLALGGLTSLYGTNLSGANAALGTQAHNAQTPGFWDQFGGAFARALGGGLVPGDGGSASYG